MLSETALDKLPNQLQNLFQQGDRMSLEEKHLEFIHLRIQSFEIRKDKIDELEEEGELEDSEYLFVLRLYGPMDLDKDMISFEDAKDVDEDDITWWSMDAKIYSLNLLEEILDKDSFNRCLNAAKGWTYEKIIKEKEFSEYAADRQLKFSFEQLDVEVYDHKFTSKKTGEEDIKPHFKVKAYEELTILKSSDWNEEPGQGIVLELPEKKETKPTSPDSSSKKKDSKKGKKDMPL